MKLQGLIFSVTSPNKSPHIYQCTSQLPKLFHRGIKGNKQGCPLVISVKGMPHVIKAWGDSDILNITEINGVGVKFTKGKFGIYQAETSNFLDITDCSVMKKSKKKNSSWARFISWNPQPEYETESYDSNFYSGLTTNNCYTGDCIILDEDNNFKYSSTNQGNNYTTHYTENDGTKPNEPETNDMCHNKDCLDECICGSSCRSDDETCVVGCMCCTNNCGKKLKKNNGELISLYGIKWTDVMGNHYLGHYIGEVEKVNGENYSNNDMKLVPFEHPYSSPLYLYYDSSSQSAYLAFWLNDKLVKQFFLNGLKVDLREIPDSVYEKFNEEKYYRYSFKLDQKEFDLLLDSKSVP